MNKCGKCNFDNFDDAVFCAGCGSPLEKAAEPAAEAPETGAAQEPEAAAAAAAPATAEPNADTAQTAPAPTAVQTVTADAYAAPAEPAAPAESNKATLWLILNIVATVLCCCANVFGIIGIIFSAIGMGSYGKGNYEDMRKKANVGKIMFIIAAVTLVLGWIAMIAMPFLMTAIPFLTAIPFVGNGSYYYN